MFQAPAIIAFAAPAVVLMAVVVAPLVGGVLASGRSDVIQGSAQILATTSGSFSCGQRLAPGWMIITGGK